jgi:hypothetical protein
MTDQWEPVDLSSLDPTRRPEWAARVEATRRQVIAALEHRAAQGPLDVVGAWARPILAAAAVLLVLLGGADALLRGPASAARGRLGEARRLGLLSEARRLGLLSEASLTHGRMPTGAELRGILREPAP